MVRRSRRCARPITPTFPRVPATTTRASRWRPSEDETMTPPVDPNAVLMTGENSFIRLSHDGGKTQSDRFSHWRVLWCPSGAGHVLFAQSELSSGQLRVFSDNAAVARWLQRTIETLLFPAFADTNLPVYSAVFTRGGDPRSSATESIVGASDVIRMTWWDCLEPFVLNAPPGFNDRP